MDSKSIDKTGQSYSQSVRVSDYRELLFISGQIPEDKNGLVPESFEEQCRLVWKNIHEQLVKSNLRFENLIKVTTFLSDRKYRDANSKIRQEILKEVSPALTIIITGIYEPNWLLEIEAIAGS